MVNKLVEITDELSEELDNIKAEVKEKNGRVSINRLIQDAVEIFVQEYRNQAVEKYSAIYKMKGDE